MSFPTEQTVAALSKEVLHHLRAYPQGLSEHELIKLLRTDGIEGFDALSMRSPLGLFQAHFLLFHCLYKLRSSLEASGETLNIHCLRITLGRQREGRSVLADLDPMASFYLDFENLERMDAQQVEQLLGDFWRSFQRNDARDEALAELGLESGAGQEEIKRRYRRLAMQHHPDRGGDTATLQRLNAAMAVLED